MGVGMKGDTRRGQSEKEWWNNHEVDVWSVRGVLSRNGSAEQEVVVDVKRICAGCVELWNKCGSQREGYHGKWVLVISMVYKNTRLVGWSEHNHLALGDRLCRRNDEAALAALRHAARHDQWFARAAWKYSYEGTSVGRSMRRQI